MPAASMYVVPLPGTKYVQGSTRAVIYYPYLLVRTYQSKTEKYLDKWSVKGLTMVNIS